MAHRDEVIRKYQQLLLRSYVLHRRRKGEGGIYPNEVEAIFKKALVQE
ncbi:MULTISPECIES: hypothetical protein [Barnesiella]|nr:MULTISPECIES: hypothetical protein [Barnesiella]MCM0689024.1 hypothetical protein [Barnesiella sp. B2-R-119]MDB0665927.1 hypothetical protein [Barnesiella intestinihominis]MDB0668708.1 hypothetical protein [Barnesiella intestinihominis]